MCQCWQRLLEDMGGRGSGSRPGNTGQGEPMGSRTLRHSQVRVWGSEPWIWHHELQASCPVAVLLPKSCVKGTMRGGVKRRSRSEERTRRLRELGPFMCRTPGCGWAFPGLRGLIRACHSRRAPDQEQFSCCGQLRCQTEVCEMAILCVIHLQSHHRQHKIVRPPCTNYKCLY